MDPISKYKTTQSYPIVPAQEHIKKIQARQIAQKLLREISQKIRLAKIARDINDHSDFGRKMFEIGKKAAMLQDLQDITGISYTKALDFLINRRDKDLDETIGQYDDLLLEYLRG